MKNLKKLWSVSIPMIVVGMLVSTPARAENIFDRIRSITSNLPVIKEALIYLFFLIGLGAIGWALMEMLKKSKGRDGGDVQWSHIGIKVIAGAFLVAITATTDTMTQTFVGSSASSNTTNIQ